MTRENLLRVIDRHGLFADAGPGFTPSERVEVLRKTIAVELVQAYAPIVEAAGQLHQDVAAFGMDAIRPGHRHRCAAAPSR